MITAGILISFLGISLTVCTVESCIPLSLLGVVLGSIGTIVYHIGEEDTH